MSYYIPQRCFHKLLQSYTKAKLWFVFPSLNNNNNNYNNNNNNITTTSNNNNNPQQIQSMGQYHRPEIWHIELTSKIQTRWQLPSGDIIIPLEVMDDEENSKNIYST